MTSPQVKITRSGPYRWSYDTAVEREAATGFKQKEINLLAIQRDNHSIWILTGISPTVWQAAGSGEPGPPGELPSGDKNDTLIFDGADWVAAPAGTTFTFSIASFTATGFSTGTQLIGTGNVNAIGSISFSATYNNGPATSGHINEQSSLNLGGTGFVGPTTNTAAIAYPAAGGSVTLTLHAGDGTDFDTETKTATYQNVIRIAALDHGDTFTQADFDGAEVSVTTGDNTQTWSSVSLAAEYWVFMVPARLGLPSYFYDNSTGFAIDMNIAGAETVSIENSLGFVEDYIVVASTYPLTYNMVGRTA